MEGAACARSGGDPEVFFTADQFSHPELTDKQIHNLNGRRKTAALTLCMDCPVREQCLEDNLTDPFGIYGGMTPKQRKALAVRRGLSVEVEVEDYDWAAVEKALCGEPTKLRPADRLEVVRRMAREGASWDEMASAARLSGARLTSAIRRVA